MYSHPETLKRVTGPITFLTKADATRWLATIEADLHRGDDLDPNGRSVLFGECADKWLAAKTELRPSTLELYEYLLRRHIKPTFDQVLVGKVSAATVREWNSKIRGDRSAT